MLVHTGQNWDHQLNGVFFEELGLRLPDHVLDVDVTSLGATLGDILRKTEAVLAAERPDAFLVLGDTNSALSLIMAKRMRIPTYHMEAGNRCFDANVPEETNRRLVDHTADFNLAYTEHARRNLLAEGLHPRRILVTGSPMREVLGQYRERDRRLRTRWTRWALTAGEYFLVSAHREENVDRPERLALLLDSLNAVAERVGLAGAGLHPPAHPQAARGAPLSPAGDSTASASTSRSGSWTTTGCRLRRGVRAVGLRHDQRGVHDPRLPGRDPARLDRAPRGPGHRRDHHDRPRPATVVLGVRFAMAAAAPPTGPCPADYAVTNTRERVVNFILSTVHGVAAWEGLRR